MRGGQLPPVPGTLLQSWLACCTSVALLSCTRCAPEETPTCTRHAAAASCHRASLPRLLPLLKQPLLWLTPASATQHSNARLLATWHAHRWFPSPLLCLQVRSISEEMGIAFLGVGFDPKWRYEDVPRMPKARWVLLPSKLLGAVLAPLLPLPPPPVMRDHAVLPYPQALPRRAHCRTSISPALLPCCGCCPVYPCRYAIMRDYMPTRGSLGRDMMFRSCTVQVNLDFESEEDMVQKMRIGMALQVGAWLRCCGSPLLMLSGVRGRGMCRRCASAWRCRWVLGCVAVEACC